MRLISNMEEACHIKGHEEAAYRIGANIYYLTGGLNVTPNGQIIMSNLVEWEALECFYKNNVSHCMSFRTKKKQHKKKQLFGAEMGHFL